MFAKWLFRKFINWQLESNERKTQAQFAEHLGIARGVLANYLNRGQVPTHNVDKLAKVLGDEIYEVLDTPKPPPPDPNLKRIEDVWPLLSDRERSELAKHAEDLTIPF